MRRDTTRREHDIVAETSIDRIARDLTIWMAARDFPRRPTARQQLPKLGLSVHERSLSL